MKQFINRTYFLPALSGLLLLLFIAAGSVELKEFNAQISSANSTEVVVTWVVDEGSENPVYVLKRKLSHDDDFTPVTQLEHEQGEVTLSGRSYSFTDSNVFKGNQQSSDAVIYALYSKNSSSSTSLTFLSQANVNVTTTAVRKTWGSIKAMFQR